MKKLRVFALLLPLIAILPQSAYNQSFKENFGLEMDIFTDIWMNLPPGIDSRTINQGVHLDAMYDMPFEKTILSFAVGIGIGSNNFYSNGLLGVDENGASEFTPFPGRSENKLPIDYKMNKLSFTYLDFPFALRFRFREGYRLSLGFRPGLRLDAHTKYHGDEITSKEREVFIKEKELQNLEDWRYGVTASIGYKFVNVIGYYGLSRIFSPNLGPDITPFSIGVALRPF